MDSRYKIPIEFCIQASYYSTLTSSGCAPDPVKKIHSRGCKLRLISETNRNLQSLKDKSNENITSNNGLIDVIDDNEIEHLKP